MVLVKLAQSNDSLWEFRNHLSNSMIVRKKMMKFKIVGDSCTDFLPSDREKEYIVEVPLTIDVGGCEVMDDESFNQASPAVCLSGEHLQFGP